MNKEDFKSRIKEKMGAEDPEKENRKSSERQMDYRGHIKECMVRKKEEDTPPKERMAACAVEWREMKGMPQKEKAGIGEGTEEEDRVLFTMEECGSCAEVKKFIKDSISSGKVREMDIREPAADDILKSLDLQGDALVVPMYAVGKGGKYSIFDIRDLMFSFGP